MKNSIPGLALLLFLLTGACRAQQPTALMFPAPGKMVMLLDADDAAKAITYDQHNGYFEKVQLSEMSIQMKKPISSGQTRETVLPEYKRYLKTEVEDFTSEEVKAVGDAVNKAYQIISRLNPDIFPDTLKLIKTKGHYYGDGVWFTREDCIIIPANELAAANTNAFLGTVFHELSHVYSRLNPEKSKQLYKLIGFESIGLDNLILPPALAERVLYNPDGVDFAQKIDLTQADKSVIHAIPVIYSNSVGYSPDKKDFFGYLEFNLYQIEKQADGKWKVLVQNDGFSSTLKVNTQPDFFRQIKDNTNYIIHPDEVLADNFSFIMQSLNGSKVTEKFSLAGKQLLEDIKKVLTDK